MSLSEREWLAARLKKSEGQDAPATGRMVYEAKQAPQVTPLMREFQQAGALLRGLAPSTLQGDFSQERRLLALEQVSLLEVRVLEFLATTIAYSQATSSLLGTATAQSLVVALAQVATDAPETLLGSGSPTRREADRVLRRLGGSTEALAEIHARLPIFHRALLSEEIFASLSPTPDRILEHIDYHRRLYEVRPLFSQEPFTLSQVYLSTECGQLFWSDLQKERHDAFREENGGRHDLLSTVQALLKTQREPIVIQGAAGTGKSAFTLHLCDDLRKRGFRPLRILLRDLAASNSADLYTLLGSTLRLTDTEEQARGVGPLVAIPDSQRTAPLSPALFDEQTTWDGVTLSRTVLILDGWDEIPLSASSSFHSRLAEILEQVRKELVPSNPRTVPVGVIVTGRPTEAVELSNFLKAETPILTLRALKPEALMTLAEKIVAALPADLPADSPWQGFAVEDATALAGRSELSEVLSMPLLAFLSLRLLKGDTQNLTTSTALYKKLADSTCPTGGNLGKDKEKTPELRGLLQETAAALTIFGAENMTRRELVARLWPGLERDMAESRMDASLKQMEQPGEQRLSKLLISYYFRGGLYDLGVEFLHKSFREYFFAERVIEALKALGQATLPDRAWNTGWDGDDAKEPWEILPLLLAPRWLSQEVQTFVCGLLDLLITPETVAEWIPVRENLTLLWQWWLAGDHQRPARWKRGRNAGFNPPRAQQWIEYALPQTGESDKEPQTFTDMDAHLGEWLMVLCCNVYYCIAIAEGWNGKYYSLSDAKNPHRPTSYVFFEISYNSIPHFSFRSFIHIMCRLNGVSIDRTNYINNTRGLSIPSQSVSNINFRNNNLTGSNFYGCSLIQSDFTGANISNSNLQLAHIDGANFLHADLSFTNILNIRGWENSNIFLAHGLEFVVNPPIGFFKWITERRLNDGWFNIGTPLFNEVDGSTN